MERNITNKEIISCLRRMKRRKAVGPDRIAIDILKDNIILVPLVARTHNKIFDASRIPQEWRTAHVKPSYKGKGSAEEAKNYRCISLASHLYKDFMSITSDRLTRQCMPKMSPNQHGFLPQRSCEGAVQALLKYVDSNEEPTYAVFVDFRAAFENVNRRKLVEVLEERFELG